MSEAKTTMTEEIRTFYLGLSREWRSFKVTDMARHERVGAYLLCGAGLVEEVFAGDAWTDDTSIRFEASAIGVWIDSDRASLLPSALRNAVPAWGSKHVSAQADDEMRVRLTQFGEENQASVRDAVAPTEAHKLPPGFLGDLFIDYLAKHPIKGRVNIRILSHSAGAPGVSPKAEMSGGALDAFSRMAMAQESIAAALASMKISGAEPPQQQIASPLPNVTSEAGSPPESRDAGGLHVDLETMSVTFEGKRLTFTPRSKQLLLLMARISQRSGHRVTFDQLRSKDDVWDDALVEDRTIAGAISRLRSKLTDAQMDRLAAAITTGTMQRQAYVMLTKL